MAQFRGTTCQLPGGVSVQLYAPQPLQGSDRPVVVLAHGALRTAGVLQPWADLLADDADVVLLDLPGHGRSTAVPDASVPAVARVVAQALSAALPGRRALLVGESIGGTIGLAIGGLADPGPVKAVVAVDPPLTTAKQWSTVDRFRRLHREEPEMTFLQQFGREALGITPTEVVDLIYYPLIGALKVPAMIATGDIALLPPRKVDGITCVFDAVDRFVVETFYPDRAAFRQITGSGHLLLMDARPQCLEIIREMLARHIA